MNQEVQNATGCSIDASVHFIQQLEQEFQIDLLDKMNVTYKMGEHIAHKTLIDFKKMAKEKAEAAKSDSKYGIADLVEATGLVAAGSAAKAEAANAPMTHRQDSRRVFMAASSAGERPRQPRAGPPLSFTAGLPERRPNRPPNAPCLGGNFPGNLTVSKIWPC